MVSAVMFNFIVVMIRLLAITHTYFAMVITFWILLGTTLHHHLILTS
jgi:hypothetical protein